MKNMNKKLIVFALGILVILTFGVIISPVKVKANENIYGGNGNAEWCRNCSIPDDNNEYIYYQEPVPIMINYSDTPIVYSNVNTGQAQGASNVNKSSTTEVSDEKDSKENLSDLAANAVFGTNSLMPSGLVQWVLLAIFILVAVILVRKVTGAENRYHQTPLKHA